VKILLTGATGQVGHSLRPVLAALGEVFAPTRAELDLAQPQALARALETMPVDVIVNPAA
jgi:dTDP-4-dehydrorhamnose reductase